MILRFMKYIIEQEILGKLNEMLIDVLMYYEHLI